MSTIMRALAALAISAVMTAPGASAEEGDYLHELQDRYRFLTPEQLLDAGYRVCAVTDAGTLSPDAAGMVMRDLESTSASPWTS